MNMIIYLKVFIYLYIHKKELTKNSKFFCTMRKSHYKIKGIKKKKWSYI